MTIFHRDPDKSEEIQPSVELSPLPETPPPLKAAPLSLSPLQAAILSHALHRKVTRVLKDLSLDEHEFSTAVVGGGARNTAGPLPDTSTGPIV